MVQAVVSGNRFQGVVQSLVRPGRTRVAMGQVHADLGQDPARHQGQGLVEEQVGESPRKPEQNHRPA